MADGCICSVSFTEADAGKIAELDKKGSAYPVNWYVAAGNSYVDFSGGIELPEGYISAASAPPDDPFLTSLDGDSIKVTFHGADRHSLEEAKVIKKCKELSAGIDLTSMPVVK